MNQDFKHCCTRRSAVRRGNTEESILLGAGSGGDDPTSVDGARLVTAEKTLVLSGNHVAIQADDPTPPATADTPLVTILAANTPCTQGLVEVHAIESIRVSTSGGIGGPPMHQLGIDGVNVQVGETQEIYMKRGMLPTDNFIHLASDMLTVDGGLGPVLINSDTSITIQVGETASITLGPQGIVLKGLLITIN